MYMKLKMIKCRNSTVNEGTDIFKRQKRKCSHVELQAQSANTATAHLVKAVTVLLLKANRRNATRDRLRATSCGGKKKIHIIRVKAAIFKGRNKKKRLMTVVKMIEKLTVAYTQINKVANMKQADKEKQKAMPSQNVILYLNFST